MLAHQSSEEVGLDKETVTTVVTGVTAKLTEFQAFDRQISQCQKDWTRFVDTRTAGFGVYGTQGSLMVPRAVLKLRLSVPGVSKPLSYPPMGYLDFDESGK